MTNTLYHVPEKCSTDRYMNDLCTCTGNNSDKFISWLLSIENVAGLTEKDPKDIYFAKVEGNLLKFLYSLPIKIYL